MIIKSLIGVKPAQQYALSRSDIESFCILSAISSHGSSAAELPTRLGLSPSLVSVVVEAIEPLFALGHIESVNEQIRVTTAGTAWRCALLSNYNDRKRR